MTKHTPAPWNTYRFSKNGKPEKHLTIISEYNHIAQVFDNPHGADSLPGTGAANARLIAAAPELLEALQTVLKLAEDGVIQRYETNKPSWHLTDELKAIARAAIAKAEGS